MYPFFVFFECHSRRFSVAWLSPRCTGCARDCLWIMCLFPEDQVCRGSIGRTAFVRDCNRELCRREASRRCGFFRLVLQILRLRFCKLKRVGFWLGKKNTSRLSLARTYSLVVPGVCVFPSHPVHLFSFFFFLSNCSSRTLWEVFLFPLKAEDFLLKCVCRSCSRQVTSGCWRLKESVKDTPFLMLHVQALRSVSFGVLKDLSLRSVVSTVCVCVNKRTGM